jgi:Fe-S-cluster containining protein
MEIIISGNAVSLMIQKVSFKILRFIVQLSLFVFEGIFTLVETIQYVLLRIVFKPEFARRGGCQRTGQCCRAIGIEAPVSWFSHPRLIRGIQAWHFLRYNFRAEGRQGNLIVYSCGYLTPDNLCGIQRFKPKLCRDFPPTPWRGITKLHKGCGFYFEKKNGKDFGKILREKA